MIESVVVCDCGCGAVHRQSSQWIQAEVSNSAFKCVPWSDRRAPHKGVLHLAGEQCAHKMLSRWLEDNSRPVEEPENPSVLDIASAKNGKPVRVSA